MDSLKQMSDTSSDLYKRTSELGLPDRLIRGFREDLREFKRVYRDILRPGYTQLGARHQPADQLQGAAGGFFREQEIEHTGVGGGGLRAVGALTKASKQVEYGARPDLGLLYSF